MGSVIGKQMRRALTWLVAACLALGMVPSSALAAGFEGGVGTDASGATQMAQEVTVGGGTTSSNVFVEVALDDFKLTDRSPNYVADNASGILSYYGEGIWAQTTGGSAPVSAQWKVTRDGADAGTFATTQKDDGTWPLALTANGASGSLRVASPGQYDCTFTAKDADGRELTTTITFLIQQNSPYKPKTVYKVSEETFDGIKDLSTWAEPSITGIVHKQVQHVAATKAEPLTPVYQAFMEQAAAYATEQGQAGAYAIYAAWSLAAKFTDVPAGSPDPYKGDLYVVIPLEGAAADAPAAGSTVTVFGFDGMGNKTPFEATVQVSEAGEKFVSFYDRTLGSYAVAGYLPPVGPVGPGITDPDPDDPDPDNPDPDDPKPNVVKVTATAEGAGFINYQGTRTWPKHGAIRYLFTPVVPGNVLESVEVLADGVPMTVPAWVTIAGYYDLDLGGLPKDVAEVTIKAKFKATGGSGTTDPDPDNPDPDNPDPDNPDPDNPDDPDNPVNKRYTLTVQTSGEGTVGVSVNAKPATAPYQFKQGSAIDLICAPTGTSQSVQSATLVIPGQPDIPLNVRDGAVSFTGPASDATVRVVFSGDDAPPVPQSTVTVIIDGGHGSIGSVFTSELLAEREAALPVSPGFPATFSLYPEEGYTLYTAIEEGVEVGAYVTLMSGGYSMRVPDIGRDQIIHVTFAKAEELPPVVPDGTFATIDVKCEATGNLKASSLPTATPAVVSVPKGAGYSFYIIPAAAGDAQLAYARMKADADLTWKDVTTQVTWVPWTTGDIARTAALDDDGELTPGVSSDTSSDEVEVGAGGEDDEHWTFVFGPQGIVKPPSSSSSSSSNSSSSGTSSGSNSSSSGSGSGNGGGNQEGYCTVTPVVVPDGSGNTHGRIYPATPVQVPRGSAVSFAFMRDVGYKVDYVEVDGRRVSGFTNSGYSLGSVTHDTTVRVSFRSQAETDAMTPVERAVHRMTSLAKTGDLTPPAITLLLCVAFGAAGVAMLALPAKRRRKEEEESEAAAASSNEA